MGIDRLMLGTSKMVHKFRKLLALGLGVVVGNRFMEATRRMILIIGSSSSTFFGAALIA